ncbi:carbohydrate-binding protein [Reinekea sp. G2M2-21]|uniref:carbohydrate-binding protein n=1 Tax=Reinekea sp. G2M2-21 TaxID=2788942 RepID=UPI0018A9E2A8|nr:carbohydrate-binding protein [Reinekea sp. G2M2-21]
MKIKTTKKPGLSLVLVGVLTAGLAGAQTFQAEDYSNYFDTTAGNTGGAYRNDNVDIEATSDVGGGYNVGWIDTSEWLSYTGLNIAQSGTYKVSLRVASSAGAQLSVDLNGGEQVLGSFNVPATGGWQQWQTLEQTVELNAGVYDLGVYAVTGGVNINWLSVEPVSTGGSAVKLEAEDYIDFEDTTAANLGGAYRSDAVDIEATTDTNGGYNVGWWEAGEWLAYPATSLAAGQYTIKLRVASPAGATVSVDFNAGSLPVGPVTIPATGGWQNWQTVEITTNLAAGDYALGVFAQTGGFNLNWIEIESTGVQPPPPPPTVTWSDEFDTLNTSVWNIESGGHGFGNNELQWYSNGQNLSIQYDAQAQSNVLVIEARKEEGGPCWHGGNCGYTSGKITTRFNKSFKYGRMEARMKLPRVQGIWPAFWMLGDNFNTQGWPQGGEIDIMEHVNTNNITSGALHGPGYSGNTPITGHLDHAASIDQDYHVYAVEWDANGIRWFVDNLNFYSVTKAQVQQYGEYVYDQPFWFLLNLAVGGNWPGDPDHANFGPTRMYVDYVRVYQN